MSTLLLFFFTLFWPFRGLDNGVNLNLWGIYGLRILDKTPLLEGVSPLSVLASAVPEYVIYWGMVVGLGALLQWGWQRWAERQQR
jgi:hypothetical protein